MRTNSRQTAAAIVIAALAMLQTACALSGQAKPAAAAAPPAPQPAPAAAAKPAPAAEPLSVPQTQVQLPAEQQIDLNAVPQLTKPEEPVSTPPPRNTRPVTRPQPKPETPAAPAGPVAAPAAPELGPIQEVLPADERKRYQESADGRKAEIQQILTQVRAHHPTPPQKSAMKRIQTLVDQSDNVEKRGDMRQADALAERALVLAREMTGGK
jgi:hypothetical protein